MSEAYRGFLIQSNIVGSIWIEKGGAFIAWAESIEDAKRQINDLLGDR